MNEELLIENHKGQPCWIKPITCQEGFCSGCEIYRNHQGIIVHGSITPKWLREQEKEQGGKE